MRIYKDFKEAMGEIERDLAEMGTVVHPHTYQDKDVRNNPSFDTMELQNYIYTVTVPDRFDLNPTKPWADMEFVERISGKPINPGLAWEARRDVWEEFLTEAGDFAYTYPGRMYSPIDQLKHIINRLQQDPASRQMFLSLWRPDDCQKFGGISRIPCSLGYYFQIRRGKLNMTYLQRSADFVTHLVNDIYLAYRLQEYVAMKLCIRTGNFCHWIGSLHVFKKDLEGVF